MTICVVPARLNSTRIQKKCLQVLGSRPLFSWVVQAALDSGAFDRVVVSTDSPEIGSHARQLGADYHARPEFLRGEETLETEVARQVLRGMGMTGQDLCISSASAPFTRPETFRKMDEVWSEARESQLMALVSAGIMQEHPYWAVPGGSRTPLGFDSASSVPSRIQSLRPCYMPTMGAYFTRGDFAHNGWFVPRMGVYPVGELESLTINTRLDLETARLLVDSKVFEAFR